MFLCALLARAWYASCRAGHLLTSQLLVLFVALASVLSSRKTRFSVGHHHLVFWWGAMHTAGTTARRKRSRWRQCMDSVARPAAVPLWECRAGLLARPRPGGFVTECECVQKRVDAIIWEYVRVYGAVHWP